MIQGIISTATLGSQFNEPYHLVDWEGIQYDYSGLDLGLRITFRSPRYQVEFYRRLFKEIEAGRAQNPILYSILYSTTVDKTLPRNLNIAEPGDPGAHEINEAAKPRHYAVGFNYLSDHILYKESYRSCRTERQVGIAFNALKNHLHLSPFLKLRDDPDHRPVNFTDPLDRAFWHVLYQTIYLNTSTRHLSGPFALLISSADLPRALQEITSDQHPESVRILFSQIHHIIVYDGWASNSPLNSLYMDQVGWNQAESQVYVTYPGVLPNEAFLINLATIGEDHLSMVKHDLHLQAFPDHRSLQDPLDENSWYPNEILVTSKNDVGLGLIFNAYFGIHCQAENTTTRFTFK